MISYSIVKAETDPVDISKNIWVTEKIHVKKTVC